MSQFPSPKDVERIKKMYPKGTRIQMERMNDPYHPIERGTKGIVDHVDDAGTLHCIFDNGRSLGVVTDGNVNVKERTDHYEIQTLIYCLWQ